MTLSESLSVALFTLTVVIGVLAILFFIIKLFSYILGNLEKSFSSKETASIQSAVSKEITEDVVTVEEEFSSGTLKLTNVDEPTAAMIMAIVSDESGIPISELCFKSIRLVSE